MSVRKKTELKSRGGIVASGLLVAANTKPWGLGKPWSEIRPMLEAAHGKRTVQLAIVPDAKPVPNPSGANQHTLEDMATRLQEPPGLNHETARRLRAINRAPDTVKDAYREGRISQTLAAKLGPKNPTPEVAAKVAEVAGEIRKLKDRKEVDRVVRDRLGQQKPSIVEQAFRLVERMTPAERSDFERQVRPLLGATQ